MIGVFGKIVIERSRDARDERGDEATFPECIAEKGCVGRIFIDDADASLMLFAALYSSL